MSEWAGKLGGDCDWGGGMDGNLDLYIGVCYLILPVENQFVA